MDDKKSLAVTEDFILWKKSFSFQTSSIKDAHDGIEGMNGREFDGFSTHVVIDTYDIERGFIQFNINGITPNIKIPIKTWIFGTVQRENDLIKVRGTAGLDPSVMFWLIFILLTIPIAYFATRERTIQHLVMYGIVMGLVALVILWGGIYSRNTLIKEFRQRMPIITTDIE